MPQQKMLVLASSNAGKAREFAAILGPLGFDIHLQHEFNIPDAPETGLSFVENALIKARHAARLSGHPAIADDSGLCVDALHGAPGIMSARFAGEHGNDAANNARLLELMTPYRKTSERTARFVCALALVQSADDPLPFIATGTFEGYIGFAPAGCNGFGYDPLFCVKDRNLTSAQLPPQLKNLISHRAAALRHMYAALQRAHFI